MNVKIPMPDIIKAIIIFIIGCVLIMAFARCSAVKRVLADPAKKEIVGREWEKQNPCVTVDSTKIIFGKDSVIFDTVTTVRYIKSTDTLINTKEILKIITKNIQRIDTVKKFIEDQRRLRIAQDSISYYHGTKDVLTKSVKEERQRGNKWMWIAIGLFSLNILFAFLNIRKSFINVFSGR